MDPFPTIFRDVSGSRKIINTKQVPEAIARNQNIHVHPVAEAKPPPRIGPTLGAIVELGNVIKVSRAHMISALDNFAYLNDTKLTKEPRSAGEAMSVTTP